MATFLDIGVLGYFRVIFAMILIFVIMYGFLSWTKPFGDKGSGLYALISIAFAILSITSKGVLTLITFMAPWFFVVVFIAFFILFVLMIFGLKEKSLTGGGSELRTWVIIVTIVILLFGLGSAFGQNTLEKTTGTTDTTGSTDVSAGGSIGNSNTSGAPDSTASNDFGSNVMNTLVNPQVLGMIVVLLVGVFAIFMLTAGFKL